MESIKSKAFSLLARKSYFSLELEKKLKEKGYSEKEIKDLLKDLKERGWLNDVDLAKRFVEKWRLRGYGPRAIQFKLRDKAGELFDAEVEESADELLFFIKKRYSRDLSNNKNKVIRSLLRRGFSFDLINKSLIDIQKEKGEN